MEMNEIIKLVQDKAIEIAEEEIVKYNKDFPDINLTDEAKNAVKERATSQLTLQLSKFHFNRESEDLDQQFNEWFVTNEEEDLRGSCRHCLADEAKKIRSSNEKNLSSLDVYLKKHLGKYHEVE
ncbi:hypothetical protein SAMN02910298_00420 [Pseudobutyrivibrio sp. YE44]|uniref:hypothetical protein n=1 Tax=Pseudobutyrivibrio sp. YE44 TaxID=1520802 RepID=UPI00088B3F48|nr:hypothetical protein [Pseudobutyrivibrio sp. YE44]SDB09458.1 hypothetical protein SAMN02910298_00420 [Pseudobutyrivibrio sp. YE44]